MRVRSVLRVVAVVVLILLVAATYQGVSTSLERRDFPRPGHLVEVGDHQLHIQCIGEGAPVVALEAPAAGVSVAWGLVRPEVAKVTRVCSYDRAGLGWSERSDGAYHPEETARELLLALEGDNLQAPFVLAGQGLGAAFVRLFASEHGDKTAAMVLIDDPVDAQRAVDEGVVLRVADSWPWLARFGLLRADRVLSRKADGLPTFERGALVAFLNRPDHLAQAARELSREEELIASARAAALPDVPIARVTVAPGHRVAFLTDKAAADRVSAAIVDAVNGVRHGARAPVVAARTQ